MHVVHRLWSLGVHYVGRSSVRVPQDWRLASVGVRAQRYGIANPHSHAGRH